MQTPTPRLPDAHAARRRGGVMSLAITALVVLNAALFLSLTGRLVAPNAAQAGTAVQGRPSEYIMIPSRPLGLNQDVLYILDTQNASLAVAGFDPANNRIDFIAPMPLQDQMNRR